MNWKNWGDHPVIVAVGLVAGIAGIASLVISLTSSKNPSVSNNGGSVQIGGSGNTINNNTQRDILNVPCFNGGGSGGWMFEPGLPKEYFPIAILNIQRWAIRNYPNHPMYEPDHKTAQYATCSIVPSNHPK
ncbi:MAG: hypothetical protein ACOVQL_13585 [Limnohabitans sp.]